MTCTVQLLYMIWTHAHHLAGYEQQVNIREKNEFIIHRIFFDLLFIIFCRSLYDYIRMPMSFSLPLWICCTGISSTKQVVGIFYGFWFWLSGMFSLNWTIHPPGIVPSSCTCIVDTIFTGKLQSDVVCQVLKNIAIFSSISFTIPGV